MASIRRHPRSRYWYACFTDHTGKQRQRSTKETDRKKAQKLAEEYETAYRKFLSEAQARKVLGDIYQEIHGYALPSSAIGDFLAGWLKKKKVETSVASYMRYRSVIERFREHLGELDQKDISFLSSHDVLRYRDFIVENLTPATANQHLKIIRMALKDAWKQNLIPENPAAKIDTIKQNSELNERHPFTIGQLKSILDAANQEWKGMILLALYTGQRLGDIVRLRWNNVDLQTETISLVTRKTGRPINLPLATPLVDYFLALAAVDDPEAYIFPASSGIVVREGVVATLSKQFHQILVSVGLAAPRSAKKTGRGHFVKRHSSGYSFHSIRHSATSLLKNAGVSEAVVMDFIGHDTRAVSQVYTHIEDEAKRKALKSLPDIS